MDGCLGPGAAGPREEQVPYDKASYHVYLHLYVPRTRTWLVSIRQRQEDAPMLPQALLYL
jgi:hypothetical protein